VPVLRWNEQAMKTVSKRKRVVKVAEIAPTLKIVDTETNARAVRFGAVTVSAGKADPDQIKRNVSEGQKALKRGAKKLATAGVTIRVSKKIPLYSADESNPEFLIRNLNGKTVRGVFNEQGRFEIVRK
jgi:hypothetical protein